MSGYRLARVKFYLIQIMTDQMNISELQFSYGITGLSLLFFPILWNFLVFETLNA